MAKHAGHGWQPFVHVQSLLAITIFGRKLRASTGGLLISASATLSACTEACEIRSIGASLAKATPASRGLAAPKNRTSRHGAPSTSEHHRTASAPPKQWAAQSSPHTLSSSTSGSVVLCRMGDVLLSRGCPDAWQMPTKGTQRGDFPGAHKRSVCDSRSTQGDMLAIRGCAVARSS